MKKISVYENNVNDLNIGIFIFLFFIKYNKNLLQILLVKVKQIGFIGSIG